MNNDWPQKSLGDICDVVNGGTPKTGVVQYWDGEHQWVTPAEMGKRSTPYIGETARALTDLGLSNSSARLLPPYSVVLSSRAPIGHLVINTEPMATNQGCKGLVPSKAIDHKFLYYYLGSIVELLNDLGTGATFKELSGGRLKEVPVPLPPLTEQQRVVGILDEAFAGIATVKANAEKNLKNSRALFAALTQSLFPHDANVPTDYSLDELSQLIVDCEHKTAPTGERGFPSIRTPNIGKGHLVLEGVYRVSETTYKEWTRRAEPQPGDLILAREAPAGNVAVIPEGLRVCLGQRTVLIRPKKDLLDPTYLAHLLLQANSQRRLLAHSRGATVQHINMKDIRAFKIAELPSLDEQRAVVAKLEDLIGQEGKLASIYRAKLAALDDLKQSLLHKAFSGQL